MFQRKFCSVSFSYSWNYPNQQRFRSYRPSAFGSNA